MTDELQEQPPIASDSETQKATMELLEAKLAAFMKRADLSESPPQDKVAIRAAYFLGINDGLALALAIQQKESADSDTEDHG